MDHDAGRFLCSEQTLEKKFSQLEQALIEYFEVGDGVYKDTFTKEYTNRHPIKEMLMRCSNPLCKRGGYQVDGEIQRMLSRNQTECETVIFCEGDEGSPKGRETGAECMNNLHIRLSLKYKSG